MHHLLVCRDFPPAPAGGIGVYSMHMARLLAEAGEVVHVVAQQWSGADKALEVLCSGRLHIHRIPFVDWKARGWKAHPSLPSETKLMHQSCPSPAVLFGWQACPLIEQIVEREKIDLVEGSEYEAPLYFFMLRRACGLGPKRQPPCLVQLHSPTELLAQFNDEDALAPFRMYAIRREEYTIAAADALLAPSQAMKNWAVERYGIQPQRIEVIPLPMGETPRLQRADEAWRKGTIAFLGRLQPCKGVFEFTQAAVNALKDDPSLQFDFIGGDTAYLAGRKRSLLSMLIDSIPPALRSHFQFHGNLDRNEILRQLQKARIGVVPSRWENFPNACMEIMASGLPVLATRNGGIPEIVNDDECGWLAQSCSVEALTQALSTAIQTSTEHLKKMGESARRRIEALCGNEIILQRQMDMRQRIAAHPTARSKNLPPNTPHARQSFSMMPLRKCPTQNGRGMAVTIPCYNQGQYLKECLDSLQKQTLKPLATIVIDDGSTDEQTLEAFDLLEREGWIIQHQENQGLVAARNAGIREILRLGHNPAAIVCLDSDDRLRPAFLERANTVFEHCPEVGVVSCWVRHFESAAHVWMQPCPTFPHQWTSNEVATFSAVRTEALQEVGLYRLKMHQGCYADWDLFNAVLASGWVGVTIPEVLGDYRVRDDSILRRLSAHAHGRMRKAMLERFPAEVARDAMDVALLSEAADSWILREEVFQLRAQVARARSFLRRPDHALRWLAKRVLRKWRRDEY